MIFIICEHPEDKTRYLPHLENFFCDECEELFDKEDKKDEEEDY